MCIVEKFKKSWDDFENSLRTYKPPFWEEELGFLASLREMGYDKLLHIRASLNSATLSRLAEYGPTGYPVVSFHVNAGGLHVKYYQNLTCDDYQYVHTADICPTPKICSLLNTLAFTSIVYELPPDPSSDDFILKTAKDGELFMEEIADTNKKLRKT